MSYFSLSLGDYAALSALLITAVAGQSAIGSYQIQASEARILGELRLQAQVNDSARLELSKSFNVLQEAVISSVKSGMEARSDEVMLSLSDWLPPADTFTVKVANMPTPGYVYDRFLGLASIAGNRGSIYTIGTNAVGSFTVGSYDDASALALKDIFENATPDDLKNIEVTFSLSPDLLSLSNTQKKHALNLQIRSLQDILSDIEE